MAEGFHPTLSWFLSLSLRWSGRQSCSTDLQVECFLQNSKVAVVNLVNYAAQIKNNTSLFWSKRSFTIHKKRKLFLGDIFFQSFHIFLIRSISSRLSLRLLSIFFWQEEALLGQLIPTDPTHILDQMASCSAQKAEETRRKGGYSKWWHLFSQVTTMCDGAQLSWKWLNTCLLMGNNEWIPCFALLTRGFFFIY